MRIIPAVPAGIKDPAVRNVFSAIRENLNGNKKREIPAIPIMDNVYTKQFLQSVRNCVNNEPIKLQALPEDLDPETRHFLSAVRDQLNNQ